MTASTALLTDRYELTMVDAALADGSYMRESVFEVFARRLPLGRRYGVVAGTGRLLELIGGFRFGEAELEWLRQERVVSDRTLDWLADYRFTGTVTGYREGEVYFPGSPVLTVEAPFAEGVLLETLVLSVLNYDSAIATAASRMVHAAVGRPLAEMGSRRANEQAAVAATRAAYIAGFSSSSNLEAGRVWGIPTMGTAAHAFTLLHDSEEDAFRSQLAAMGTGTTLLVDTFDVEAAIETGVRIAGPQLGGIRLDSGDLPRLVAKARAQLDALGARDTKITVTNDLDEYAIAALTASPVDNYGVGTAVVTGSGAPAAGMVYKLVAHQDDAGEWVAVAKKSDGKASVGGRKVPVRHLDSSGTATAEVVHILTKRPPRDAGRELLVTLMSGGEADAAYLGPAGVSAARAHNRKAIDELPEEAFRLGAGDPALTTIFV